MISQSAAGSTTVCVHADLALGVGAGTRDRVHTPWPCAMDHEGLLKAYMICNRK